MATARGGGSGSGSKDPAAGKEIARLRKKLRETKLLLEGERRAFSELVEQRAAERERMQGLLEEARAAARRKPPLARRRTAPVRDADDTGRSGREVAAVEALRALDRAEAGRALRRVAAARVAERVVWAAAARVAEDARLVADGMASAAGAVRAGASSSWRAVSSTPNGSTLNAEAVRRILLEEHAAPVSEIVARLGLRRRTAGAVD